MCFKEGTEMVTVDAIPEGESMSYKKFMATYLFVYFPRLLCKRCRKILKSFLHFTFNLKKAHSAFRETAEKLSGCLTQDSVDSTGSDETSETDDELIDPMNIIDVTMDGEESEEMQEDEVQLQGPQQIQQQGPGSSLSSSKSRSIKLFVKLTLIKLTQSMDNFSIKNLIVIRNFITQKN